MTAQRLRIRFSKGERVRYISHLDVLRYWERAIRRAGLPLSYSQGFTPHPRIAFASPLPLGFTSDAELMDVSLDARVDLSEVATRLAEQVSDDLAVLSIHEVSVSAPAPQASLAWADYRVDLPGLSLESARDTVRAFLAQSELLWTEEKKDRNRTYNLRAAVASLTVEARQGSGVTLQMRLQADQDMTARPEQVVAALFPGVEPGVFTRTGFVLDEPSPAREAWRRRGRFES